MKGNRHTEPQRGVSERNRRVAAALGAEMGSLSRSITRRSAGMSKLIPALQLGAAVSLNRPGFFYSGEDSSSKLLRSPR